MANVLQAVFNIAVSFGFPVLIAALGDKPGATKGDYLYGRCGGEGGDGGRWRERWAVAGAVGGEGVGGVWVVVVRWWSGGVFVAGVWRGFVQESVR